MRPFPTLYVTRLFPQPRSLKRRVALFFCLLLTFLPSAAQVDAEKVTILGRNALSVDDNLTAIKYFNQAIEAKPFLPRPWYYRAYAKFTLEDYAGAEEDCNKSIGLNPFIVEVYQLRALCRIHRENYQGAITDYDRTIAELPNDRGARYNRALCHLQVKDYRRADADLDYLLRRQPRFYRAYMVLAQSKLEQKDTLLALATVDTLLTLNPSEADAWAFKGRHALGKEDFLRADSFLSRSLELRPEDFELFIARAQARHALGRFSLSIADYDRALALEPNHFVAHYNRGLLRSFVGDLNNAITDFDFVLSVEPDNTLAAYNRAGLRAAVGDFRGAIEDYTMLIKAYPNFIIGYMERAECRRKIGDTKGALADETVVARSNLDLVFGKNQHTDYKKVRRRSEHELTQYKQLVQEDNDTTRNFFGTIFGKVQNDKVGDELRPMYTLGYRPSFRGGYRAVGFLPEAAKLTHGDTPSRRLFFSSESDPTSPTDAEEDFKRLSENQSLTVRDRSLLLSTVYAARYDYSESLHEVNKSLASDSLFVPSLLQRASVCGRLAQSETAGEKERKNYLRLALSDLSEARRLSSSNAYIDYNEGCLLALAGRVDEAIAAFTRALEKDARLAEAYYNRALLLLRKGENEAAATDLSLAGQLGLPQAYGRLKQMRK